MHKLLLACREGGRGTACSRGPRGCSGTRPGGPAGPGHRAPRRAGVGASIRDPGSHGLRNRPSGPNRACRRPSNPGPRGRGPCGSELRPGQHRPGGQQRPRRPRAPISPTPRAPTSPLCPDVTPGPSEAGAPEPTGGSGDTRGHKTLLREAGTCPVDLN